MISSPASEAARCRLSQCAKADVLVGRDQCLLVVLADMVIMSESASIVKIWYRGDTVLEPGGEARAGPAIRHTLAQARTLPNVP